MSASGARLGRNGALLATAVMAVVACRGQQAARANPNESPLPPFARPNVLLITIDALRADHLGTYGYRRGTSPHIDAFAHSAVVFERAYTYWPKTRGSFAMMLTGRTPARNGYGARHPGIADFNPTLASVLQAAGYRTVAAVDNPNVAKVHGYAKGFESYRETWEEPGLATEMDRTRAITDTGVQALTAATPDRPLFLWLHYVNPHAPYTPPAPYGAAFLGGVRREWAVRGRDQLGFYVAQYDGEIATVDAEVGRILDTLRRSPAEDRTVVVIASDHGEDLFDPCLRIPLVLSVPGVPQGRRISSLASTLDIMPTILDAVKVSYSRSCPARACYRRPWVARAPGVGGSLHRTTVDSRRPTMRISSWWRLPRRAGLGSSSTTGARIRVRHGRRTCAARPGSCPASSATPFEEPGHSGEWPGCTGAAGGASVLNPRLECVLSFPHMGRGDRLSVRADRSLPRSCLPSSFQ